MNKIKATNITIQLSKKNLFYLPKSYAKKLQREARQQGYILNIVEKPETKKSAKLASKKYTKEQKEKEKARKAKEREDKRKQKFIDSMNSRLKKHFTDENRNIYVKNLKDVKGLVFDKDGLISHKSKIDPWTEKSLKGYIPDKRKKVRESDYMVDSLLLEVKDEYYEDKKKLDAITDSAELKLKTKESDFETKTRLIKKLGRELKYGEYKKAEATKKKLMKYYSKKSKTTVGGV